MKAYYYNSSIGLVIQYFETKPDFECLEVTDELRMQVDQMTNPILLNGKIVESNE
jgi:hypothetical protein